jgi:hypothetical protein
VPKPTEAASARSCPGMSDDPPPEILGSLPNTRPHRRSSKRPSARATAGSQQAANPRPRPTSRPTAKRSAPARKRRTESIRQPNQPVGNPPAPRARRPVPVSGTELVGTIVQAAGELAEIGLSVGARTLRNAVARLPRP